jgi:hypothetical protein
MEQPVLGVVNEHAGGDVHGIDQTKPLLHPALPDERTNGLSDIDETASTGDFKPKLLGE